MVICRISYPLERKRCEVTGNCIGVWSSFVFKNIELNDVQEGVVAIIFKYCDDNQMPLLDLKDFKKVLNYSIAEGEDEFEKEYGKVASTTASTILRKNY